MIDSENSDDLTIGQVAKLLSISRCRIEEMLRAGNIPGVYRDSKRNWWRFPPEAIESLKAGVTDVDALPSWQEWWESVDEIVFLYLGLVLSFMSETAARIFTLPMMSVIALLLFGAVVGYVYWKKRNF